MATSSANNNDIPVVLGGYPFQEIIAIIGKQEMSLRKELIKNKPLQLKTSPSMKVTVEVCVPTTNKQSSSSSSSSPSPSPPPPPPRPLVLINRSVDADIIDQLDRHDLSFF